LLKKILNKYKKNGLKRILLILARIFIQKPRVFFYKCLSDGNVGYQEVVLNQPALFSGNGIIKLGRCFIGVWPSPFYFSTYAHIEARATSAKITIGNSTWLNNNATIIADKTSITIGDNVLIGQNVFICDSDFHGLKVEDRSNGKYDVAPVYILDNVFIGANVSILKGITIGENSVIASGSIVSSSIPANVVAGGIPAKVLKNL
jgi:maltose O-acetyltransferase